MKVPNVATIAICAFMFISCAHNAGSDPVQPPSVRTTYLDTSNRHLLGLWEIAISSDHQSVDLVPLRTTDMHLNAVRLLEETACTDCLTISNVQSYPPDELAVDLTLHHPYPGLIDYTVFDVRGIFMSPADFTFPESGRSVAWGDGMARIMNADGYTSLFNPTEFPETQPGPPALRYIPGKFASGGDLSSTLMPYIAYGEDETRRMFSAGAIKTRTVRLRVPDGPLEFGYAVDGCWVYVPGGVTNPETDFPPEANCLEAYRIDVQTGSGLVAGGGNAVVNVEVYDHQGLDTINGVTVESPELFPGEIGLSYSTATGGESYLFTGEIENSLSAGLGEYPLLVRVSDVVSDENLGVVDAWNMHAAHVGEKKGWVKTWGGLTVTSARSVALDSSGNIYITGYFADITDFDPGPGVDERSSNGYSDAFLCKFNPNGIFQWVHTWGGSSTDYGRSIAVDGLGNLLVVGGFQEIVDFDPGPGIDEREGGGVPGIVFLCKYNLDGEYQWVRVWNSDGWAVDADVMGDIYVTGYYTFYVDFDPGPDEENHWADDMDVFLSKFDTTGDFQWVRTWGDYDNDSGFAVVVDDGCCVYIGGEFRGNSVDFDPGPGEDLHDALGKSAFLCRYDSNGNYLWGRSWGAVAEVNGLAFDGDDSVYCTGAFQGTVDFDPGPDTLEYTSSGNKDAFLSRFDTGGELNWARTWGSYYSEIGRSVTADDSGNVWVSGDYKLTVDFDPGPGIEEYTSNGAIDVFLSRFHSSGEFQWAGSWGGPIGDEGPGVSLGENGDAYVVGFFHGNVDFDPGFGTEYHDSAGYQHAYLSKFPPDGEW